MFMMQGRVSWRIELCLYVDYTIPKSYQFHTIPPHHTKCYLFLAKAKRGGWGGEGRGGKGVVNADEYSNIIPAASRTSLSLSLSLVFLTLPFREVKN